MVTAIMQWAYLLQDSYFPTCKGLQGPSQFLILYASGVLNVLKAKILGIVEQHQNYSLEGKRQQNQETVRTCLLAEKHYNRGTMVHEIPRYQPEIGKLPAPFYLWENLLSTHNDLMSFATLGASHYTYLSRTP